MDGDTPPRRKAQLDTAQREHLEETVEGLRERVEDNIRYQLTQRGLDEEPSDPEALEEADRRIAEAIEMEADDDHSWSVAFEEYVTGVGYTVVNRLTALRCLEVRGFLDEEVTVFMENGLTPAAETLVREEFLLEEEALLAAYHEACDDLAAEIEVLFDRSSAYSGIDPDEDTYEDLFRRLDEVPDAVWRADDVLGWVYEYYNRPVVEALDAKNALEPADVGPANQFYTPHWVVRMLTDNSLGKLYLEATDRTASVPPADALSVAERTERVVTPEAAPGVPELCTYLLPDEERRAAPSFDHPSELRVVDPACGSGHFLLYAFDVLERIWWAETDLDRSEIPARILERNLHGVDIDLRSCQLAAFNLYLKARTRTEAEGGEFEMPSVGIVCADARVAEVEEAVDVLDGITGDGTDVREALGEVIEEFQTTEALGSLLDVQGALSEAFMAEQTDVLEWSGDEPHTLNAFLTELRTAVEERTGDSFGERNLRSFLHLLVVLTQDYDVALMNPPYGSGGRMPDGVQAYVEDHYDYTAEYYINFFEACDRLVRPGGRVGMLVPWSFMFRKWFQGFREEFIGERGAFDFFAEFGYDILDNATVGTVGTVIRSGVDSDPTGTFIRLADVAKAEKERRFTEAAFDATPADGVQRKFEREAAAFERIPGTPLSYWVPDDLRALFAADRVIDAANAGVERGSVGHMSQGLATADDDRFVRYFWEVGGYDGWSPFAKGGADAGFLPQLKHAVRWGDPGREVSRYVKSYPRNVADYGAECLTYTVFKRGGRRFGYLHEGAVFSHVGSVIVPDCDIWTLLGYANSHLFNYLMIAQTQERNWDVGLVSRMPWPADLDENETLAEHARAAVTAMVRKRQYDFVSPHYDGPVLLDVLGIDSPLPQYDHPHRGLRETLSVEEPAETVSPAASLEEMGVAAARHLERIEADLQSRADAIDEAVFDCFGITDAQRETVLEEIALRTIEDPRERETYDPVAITEPTDDFPGMVKDLLLHLALRAVHDAEDGIVPLSDVGAQASLVSRIEAAFERLFGEHAAARLAEVDRVLGDRPADEEAYPNLRAWLRTALFDYQVAALDRTPIMWRLTTERLVSDPAGEGFGCLVDYHQLDAGLFDRLQSGYLEPRKADLRQRRSGANRRRGDESLAAAEQARAAETYTRCESGLEQIDAFEQRLSELAQPSPREWPAENRQTAAEAAETVAAFREETATRLATVDELAQRDDVAMAELFSPSFYRTVQEQRTEWLDALDALEAAFEAYAGEASEPVGAHHADLFDYYDDLVGSAHYASNGILFTTYYFAQFEAEDQARLDQTAPSARQRLLSELATGLDAYEALAEEIAAACDDLGSDIPADWATRAHSEITTAGYQPIQKHGVEVNIGPLADAAIVPKTVDDEVR